MRRSRSGSRQRPGEIGQLVTQVAQGVEQADALAAVTDDDNMNIMISQVAKEIFHVPCVMTRLYDPQREAIMRSMGLTTVCPTNLAVENIKRCAAHSGYQAAAREDGTDYHLTLTKK